MATLSRVEARNRRHRRVRKTVSGSAERPRLCVFRSNQHMYAQVVDDLTGRTLAAASTLDQELRKKLEHSSNKEAAKVVGSLIAVRAKKKGINEVVFDRGGNLYHGRVRALAEEARSAGLVF